MRPERAGPLPGPSSGLSSNSLSGPPHAPLLRTQLLRWLLVPLILLLVLDAAISYVVASRFAQGAHDRALEEIARELSLHVRVDPQGRTALDLPDAARRVLLEDPFDRVVFELSDAAGARIAGDAVPAPANGDLAQGEAGNGRVVLYDARVEIEGAVRQARAVQRRLTQPQGAVVRVAETRVKRDELARQILLSVLLPQVLLIALAAALVRLGVIRGLRPLDALQGQIAERSHRDRRPLDEAGVPGELRPVVQSMNRLIARLDEVLTLQSRFIADAAHQLKTPVAGLKAQVELLMRQPDSTDHKSVIAHLYVGMERMSRLVSQLLSLARNEPDAARLSQFQALDLDKLALDVAMAWVPQALQRGIDLGFEGCDAPVMIHGDPGRLRELLDNLIDNAIRYSRENGRATVRVFAGSRPTVAVSDDGPTIPPAERQRIFERFHRLAGPGDGSGLGLAIAREIASLHRAEIVLGEDEHDGVGNVFSVIFPPYAADSPEPAAGEAGSPASLP